MRTPQPLPAALHTVAFSSADARRAGVRASRLRARDLHHPFHAVHTPVAPGTVRERCEAYLRVMTDGAYFSHRTAAVLLGVPLRGSPGTEPLHVSVVYPRSRPRGRGIVGHSLGSVNGSVVDGLPISAPAHVWCQLSGVLDRDDLVAAGDHLVGARSRAATASLDELAALSAELHRTKGARARAWALERIRSGADSRPESLLRLFLEQCGYRDLEVNAPVPVARGRVLLRPDLSIPSRRLAFEYEGDGHRVDRQQWHTDIERRDLLEAAGWRVIRVTSRDLFGDRDAFAERLDTFAPNVGFPRGKHDIRRESRAVSD